MVYCYVFAAVTGRIVSVVWFVHCTDDESSAVQRIMMTVYRSFVSCMGSIWCVQTVPNNILTSVSRNYDMLLRNCIDLPETELLSLVPMFKWQFFRFTEH